MADSSQPEEPEEPENSPIPGFPGFLFGGAGGDFDPSTTDLIKRAVDMRYVGQEHAVTVDLPMRVFDKQDRAAIRDLNPVLFFENMRAYHALREDVPDDDAAAAYRADRPSGRRDRRRGASRSGRRAAADRRFRRRSGWHRRGR